ncbi:MAG: hypothetical protein ABIJ28_03820 [Patescibacteria group bacterium]|nr:hypothetical protein [Patescibacteria group bacterium]
MANITIPKEEYKKLKQFSTAYVKIVEEIAKVEIMYPYDYKYIDKLTASALKDYKKGKCIKAKSIDEALSKFKKK